MTETTPLHTASIKAFAERKGISVGMVYKEANAGRLRISKIGSRSIIYADDEAAYDRMVKAEADARQALKKSA